MYCFLIKDKFKNMKKTQEEKRHKIKKKLKYINKLQLLKIKQEA